MLEQEQVWLVDKGKKGVIPDSLLQKQLEESEQKITLAKIHLNDIHNEELEIDSLLSEAEVFIRTPELAWYSGMFEAKLKYQRMIFPEGLTYPFGDLSNTKIGRPFKVINDFAASYSNEVNHKDFSWNQYLLELKQLYSIIPETEQPTHAYNY